MMETYNNLEREMKTMQTALGNGRGLNPFQLLATTLDTAAALGHGLDTERKNSFNDGSQSVKRGFFCALRARLRLHGREWANRIPRKGEYARRSLTVLSSRPFSLGNAKGNKKINEVLHV